MRDDIRKGLPLKRRWRRVVKVCGREGDLGLIPESLANSVLGELSELRGSPIEAARVGLLESSNALFPREVFVPAYDGATQLEREFLRECAASAPDRLAVDDAVLGAVERALVQAS